MEQIKKVPFSRLKEFNNAGHGYIARNPEERSSTTYALNKLLKFYEKRIQNTTRQWQEELNEETEEIRVKYCEKDKETGVFKEKTYGDGPNMVRQKVFTAENERLANKEIKALAKRLEEKYENVEIELEKVHIVPVPPSMDISFIQVFQDFIYAPMSEEELERHYLAQGKKEDPKLVLANAQN